MAPQFKHFPSSLVVTSLAALTYARPTSRSNEFDGTLPANSFSTSVEWVTCPEQLHFPPNVQCTSVSVPIDWDSPHGDHFDLGVVKLPAALNSTARIGNLFVNPGGPGGRGSDIVAGMAAGVVPTGNLTSSFDVIGVDPRGVGLSNQVKCDLSIFAERVSLFPQTQDELDKLVDKNKRLGRSCQNLSGPLFEHIDTISSAKDHEAVRIALGNEPFNFVGMSYGSQLGAQYAALFPDNIRTLALDGILHHSPTDIKNILVETTTYEMGLSRFFDWASKSNESALVGEDVEVIWSQLIDKARESPIPAPACDGKNCLTDVTAEEIQFNAHRLLTFFGAAKGLGAGASWARLASILRNATQGDASALSTQFVDPTPLSFLAIGCLDWDRATDSLSSSLIKQDMVKTYAPSTGGATSMWNLQYGCLGWPVPVKNPPKKLDIQTNTTVLIVQSSADPVTGMPWALELLQEIQNHAFVLRQGDGHTSFPLGGETFEVISDYLISGQAPKGATFTES